MKTILVVDDEFDLTSTLKAILEHHGYRAEVCSNGREALNCVVEMCPDLILLDVMMPLGNGYQVLEKIRTNQALADVPVLLMNSVPPALNHPVQWQAFLQKPLTIDPLLRTIAQFLGEGSPTA